MNRRAGRTIYFFVPLLGMLFGQMVTNPAQSLASGRLASANQSLQTDGALTWQYFEQATANQTALPDDRIDISESGSPIPTTTTSPTDIGLYLMSLAAARDLGIVNEKAAGARMGAVIRALSRLAKWHGFLYNWYDTTDGSVLDTPAGKFVSTVDNGWLAAGLIVARQAFPFYYTALTKMLNKMDFSIFYDSSVGQLYGGFDPIHDAYTTWHYGNINTESRVADYIAIGQGKTPATLWWSVYRTLPTSWTWQLQKPAGFFATHDGVQVFEGHYKLDGLTFVPSWGGSMFETLMPTLVLDEQSLAPRGLGLNDARITDLQIRYAQSRHYPVWGISPCALPANGYGVFGVPGLGSVKYEENGTITPYATFLALPFRPRAAEQNLARLASLYHMMGPDGFYDSVNVMSGAVTHAYLALDEGMVMAALDNALRAGRIRAYFNSDPIGRRPQSLLSEENLRLN